MRLLTNLTRACLAFGLFGGVAAFDLLPALAERACVRTDAGAKVCGELLPNDRSSTQKLEDNEFTFELQGCERSGSNVKCNISIRNIAATDRELRIHGGSIQKPSRMISTSGEEFIAKQAHLGEQKRNGSAQVSLIHDVPIQAAITFENIPREIQRLAVLEVKYFFYEPSNKLTSMQFRDIPIQN